MLAVVLPRSAFLSGVTTICHTKSIGTLKGLFQ